MIPADWGVSNLSEVFSITAGGDFDPKIASPIFTSNHPFPVYANALKTNAVHSFASEHRHLQKSVTVSARGMIGFANYRDHPFTAIGRLLVLQPSGSNDGRYFAEYINHRIEFAIESTGVPQLTAPQIGSYLVAVPSPLEQSAIAEALSDVDRGIAAVEAVIAKKRALKTATMQALLSGTRRLPGFSGEWEMKALGEVAQIDRDNLGASTSPDYAFRYISLEDVDRGILRQTTRQTFATAPSRARRRVAVDDVLFGTVRPNLQSHLLVRGDVENLIGSTGFAVIRCNPSKANPTFVFFNLFGGFVERQIERLLAGSNYPAISNKDVAALQLKMPDVEEQQALAEVIFDMDSDVNRQTAKLAKLRHLKTGMMQQLLTGKIRLV